MLDKSNFKRPREEPDEELIDELCDIRADQLHSILRHAQKLAFKAPDVARQLLAMIFFAPSVFPYIFSQGPFTR